MANAIACDCEEADLNRINALMVGSMEPVLPELVAHHLVEKKGTKLVMSPLARVMAEHFIGMERLLEVVRLTKKMDDPVDIIAELESEDLQHEKKSAGEETAGAAETAPHEPPWAPLRANLLFCAPSVVRFNFNIRNSL